LYRATTHPVPAKVIRSHSQNLQQKFQFFLKNKKWKINKCLPIFISPIRNYNKTGEDKRKEEGLSRRLISAKIGPAIAGFLLSIPTPIASLQI
jgi:hypothetical protein